MKRLALRSAAIVFCMGALGSGRADPPGAAGIRGELSKEFAEVEKKLVDLAAALPPEKYSWRPADGVRSVSEVYAHVAAANYYVPGFLGVQPPPGFDPRMEKTVADKAKVVQALKKSFENVRRALDPLSDSDLERKVMLFGREVTLRSAYLMLLNHAHEHMGQSIAYARMNGVTPPWTAVESPPTPGRKPSR